MRRHHHLLALLVPFALIVAVTLDGCYNSESPTGARADLMPTPGGAGGSGDSTLPAAGQLTAGEWRDLDNWTFWLGLYDRADLAADRDVWQWNAREAITVHVMNDGRPVNDAVVTLRDQSNATLWTARTDNRGAASLFPSLMLASSGPYTVAAEAKGVRAGITLAGGASLIDTVLELPVSGGNTAVDVMFTIDATGSMGDELRYLQSELKDVMTRAEKLNSEDLVFRLSCNFYRDVGDEYLVRAFAFTSSLDEAVGHLVEQSAGGGGDYEEAMEVGLDDAIHAHDWRPNARARLLFLVLDAPPHETADRITRLHELARDAAALGIRIIPISASGANKRLEFLLRDLDVATGGTYIFLTDNSGIGGSHLTPTVGTFTVEKLNDLLVKVISRYVK